MNCTWIFGLGVRCSIYLSYGGTSFLNNTKISNICKYFFKFCFTKFSIYAIINFWKIIIISCTIIE